MSESGAAWACGGTGVPVCSAASAVGRDSTFLEGRGGESKGGEREGTEKEGEKMHCDWITSDQP